MKRIITTIATLACALSLVAQTTVVEAPQTDAIYRLPMEGGVKITAKTLTPLNLGMARMQNLVDFCAWELIATEATDVVAPRDGVVESATDGSVLILHPDGLYTQLDAMGSVAVKEGDKVTKGDKVGVAQDLDNGKWRVWVAAFHLKNNPAYGQVAQSGKSQYLYQYINPVFSTRGKCKVQLSDGGSYTVKARTWCWPWE